MRSHEDLSADHLFWSNIDVIESSIGLSQEFIAQSLGFNPQKFQFYKNNQLSVPFKSVKNLTYNMGLNLESLLISEMNENHLKEATKTLSLSRIPNHYQTGNGSKSFSIRHILKTAKKYNVYEDVCAHFKIDKFIFEHQMDYPVCVQLASDILQYISQKVQLTEEDYNEMSYFNAFHFKDSQFGKTLSNSNNLLDMYERFFSIVNEIEENWTYEIQNADNKKILINSYASERVSDIYKRRDFSSITFSKFRVAMAAHLTQYKGFVGAKGTILKSVHHGDSFCQFQIDLSNLRPLSS